MANCKELERLIALNSEPTPFYSPNGKQRDYVRRNQLLPLYWRHLSQGDAFEIADLLDSPILPEASLVEIEARLAIACILTTGRKLEALAKLRVFPHHWSLQRSGRCFGLVTSGDRSEWVLPLGTPTRSRKRYDGASETELYTVEPSQYPTFTWTARDWVRRYWCAKKIPAQNGGIPLLSTGLDDLTAEIKRLLRGRRSRHFAEPRHASWTIMALERYLCAALTHEPGGDLASAARITDDTRYLSATVINYGVTELEGSDENSLEEAARGLNTIGDSKAGGQVVGSPHTPDTKELQFLIAKMLLRIENAVSGSDDFHRAYSEYTAFLVSFGLGHRGEAPSVLPSSRAIDLTTGFVAIHDTSRTSKHTHTRLTWVAPVIRQQIRFYEDYLAEGEPRFPYDVNQHVKNSLFRSSLPFFALKGLRWWRLSTSAIYDSIKRNNPTLSRLKLNAGRHWLRSNMLGCCSEESINAFLGHWCLGREPWSYGSTLDPMRYSADLEGTVPSLLANLGLRPVSSRAQFNDN